MNDTPLCRIFGVRHLSPAAAHHLRAVLAEMKPTAVLVEGPSDATGQIEHLVHKETKPPLAILFYTNERPVRSILYPLASYSPEWIALTWGIRHKAETRLIDLPSSVFLKISEPKKEEGKNAVDQLTEEVQENVSRVYLDDPYAAIAMLCGDPDHETWWERHFEHTTDVDSYSEQIFEFGKGLRDMREMKDDDENLIREAYMRRQIQEVLAAGHDPEKVLVVCGAFHAPVLTHRLPAMTDDERSALPTVESSLTLMPYSYFRLSAQSGYGAGNHAPNYYQKLFDNRSKGNTGQLPARFLTELCHHMRKAGHVRSAADVIDAVRLATSLAALNGSSAPTLRDLRDAATTCLGRGDHSFIRPMLLEVEVGTAVGKLPKGICRTMIQGDFYAQIGDLSLAKYLCEKAEQLDLDLTERIDRKSAELAFRDRNRSIFLHRLRVLEVPFGERMERKQVGTKYERWKLRWTPDSEIQLIESTLLGDSIEQAATFKLSQQLAACERVDSAAQLIKDSIACQMVEGFENARRRLNELAVDAADFVQIAKGCEELDEATRYRGRASKVDPEPLRPLLAQLFLRGTLGVRQACLCDDEGARKQIAPAILRLVDVAREQKDLVDAPQWNRELDSIAAADDLNPYLSGYVMSLILPRVSEDTLATEVSRRLSPGVAAEVGAGWFEGLVQYNREALFQRLGLWRQIDAYLQTLDEVEFRRALVPLRRAFAGFSQGQVRRVVSNLVEVSPDSSEQLKQSVDAKLSDEEVKQLQDALKDLHLG